MNLLGIIDYSEVNGPGKRTTIWTQFCPHKCFNCYQPESWSNENKIEISPVFLAYKLRNLNPDGLTISGGDPFYQKEELLEFLNLVQPKNDFLPKGIICFTGYTIEEIEDDSDMKALLPYIDLLIEGRYIDSLRVYNGLHGSSNQRFIWNTAKGRGKDLIDEKQICFDQDIEVHIKDGEISVTGFPDLSKESKTYLKKLGVEIKVKK
jgi:anaerobic ribonucleoside-triphosphate reductase activating protein